jgi:phosphatidate cytidylyltransferase
MNYLRFRKLYQADNDGTFWPGYIELPDSDTELVSEPTDGNKKFNIFSNPRVYTGVGLLALVSLFFLNKTTALIFLVIVSLIATKEWFDIFEYGIMLPYPLLLYASLAPLMTAYFYGYDNYYLLFFIFPLGVMIYTGTFVDYEIYEKFGSSFLFLVWFGSGLAAIAYILSNFGPLITFLLLISISISDITAYEFGKRYGKRKLAKNISPNKTVEGFLAGLFFGVVFSYFVLSTNFALSTTQSALLSIIFIIFATLGDLFESKIKRSVEIKDASSLLPGHGGVLDRIDSQLLSFPVLVLFLHFLDLIQ